MALTQPGLSVNNVSIDMYSLIYLLKNYAVRWYGKPD